MTGWSITVILPLNKVIRIVEFQLFFEWQSIKLATEGKLAIDFFLADVEVLDIEET